MKYIPLSTLSEHPKNVRAKAEYDPEGLESLAASIHALGLLQSLIAQQLEDGTFGVLAGRRRLTAMRMLVERGDLVEDFKVPCKVIGKDVDHVTAVSLAENAHQEVMEPLDAYEAFAAMLEEGSDVAAIAKTFGVTERSVKERLRYGLIHPEIRAAARAKTLSLDAMKAYASHPCQATQKRVFDGLVGDGAAAHQPWRVRKVLMEQDLRADDPLGAFVLDAYRKRGGEIIEGLFPEDTVLKDRALAETLLEERLSVEAEAIKVRHGFKWSEGRLNMDPSEVWRYSRIQETQRDLSEAEEEKLAAMAERMDAIADALNSGAFADEDEEVALHEEHETLEEAIEALQTGFDPEEAARAGVIVSFYNGQVWTHLGLVREQDLPRAEAAEAEGDAEPSRAERDAVVGVAVFDSRLDRRSGGSAPEAATEAPEPEDAGKVPQALLDDLAVERAEAIAAAVAEDPALAYDATVFKMALCAFSHSPWNGGGLEVRMVQEPRSHSRPEARDTAIGERLAAAKAALDLSFLDPALSVAEQFDALRALDAEAKGRILAMAAAMAVSPRLGEPNASRAILGDALAAAAVPDIRAVWRPTADNYWSRVTKGHMLAVLRGLGMAAEAETQAGVKKSTLADYMETLFASPFATLSAAQHAAIARWTPPRMATGGEAEAPEMDAADHAETEADAA